MVKPLTFKGDKKSRKRKHAVTPEISSASISNDLATNTQVNEGAGDDDNSWVSADAVSDLSGPVVIVLPTSPTTCIACDATGKVFTSAIENLIDENPATAEPHDVRQVWIANRVAGTENFSFKGHHGRYLNCDKFGIVSALREAVSPEESFICILSPEIPGTFSIQTQRDKFLSVTENAKPPELRGDADALNFNTTFRIRMQARFKPKLKANKENKAREKISRKELEEAVGRRLEDDEVKRLKRARREGNYHEAILDVRVKGKHDKFASS
ncbi:MAG: hypothetical protein M1834_006934 [Cirrosporium novae-zelandiae]|nr:MAG: hypothetical protein M1834_006934 [Cirrosporium novae-zelandiae]